MDTCISICLETQRIDALNQYLNENNCHYIILIPTQPIIYFIRIVDANLKSKYYQVYFYFGIYHT